jgi:hypothetical protein
MPLRIEDCAMIGDCRGAASIGRALHREIAGLERAPFDEFVARHLLPVGEPREVVSGPEARTGRPGRGALARSIG